MNTIDTLLAEMLGNYPAIWNKKCAAYKDTIKRDNSIKELARILNTTVDIVLARYKALREKYRKEKIKIQQATTTGSGQIDFEPWCLMSTLSFFDSVQLKRRTARTFALSKKIEEKEDILSHESLSSCIEDNGHFLFLREFEEDKNVPSTSERNTHTPAETQTKRSRSYAPPISSGRRTPSPPIDKRQKISPASTSDVDKMIGRIANAAEATAKAAATVPVSGAMNRFQIFGTLVGETLTNINEEFADDAILEITQLLHKYKKMNINCIYT